MPDEENSIVVKFIDNQLVVTLLQYVCIQLFNTSVKFSALSCTTIYISVTFGSFIGFL